jgi:hypothetical protein
MGNSGKLKKHLTMQKDYSCDPVVATNNFEVSFCCTHYLLI